jgi:hypothetical protein
MSDPLATYLNDHLAGARFALDMLERLRDGHPDDDTQRFAGKMHAEIEEDRKVLERLAETVGGGGNIVKDASAWFVEKASRLKLRLGSKDDLAIFEAFEALSLGILGKLKLWQALSVVASQDSRLQGFDFDHLAARAKSQHDEVEGRRLTAVKQALVGSG